MFIKPLIVSVAVALLLVPSTASAAKHCDEPGTTWERATPAEAGMDAGKLNAAVAYATSQLSTSVRVYRYGCLVAEDAINPESTNFKSQSFSTAKSVTSMIFGRAWTLGFISPDDPIGSLFGEADAQHGALLLRHLLTMTSGEAQQITHDFNLAMPDRVRDALTIDLPEPPGTTWNYWQTGPAMVAASVARAVHEDFQAFAQRELFGPIGITRDNWTWTTDSAGNTSGFWGLFMRADDYGRLGELLRRGGVWDGRRLLSKRYVHDALMPTKPFGCYGFLIWRQATTRCNWPVFLGLPKDMWQFNGLQGQLVTTFPTQGVMTVRTGVDPQGTGGWASGFAERQFHDMTLAAITDTPVSTPHLDADPSLPSQAAQQRGSDPPLNEIEGATRSVVQPALPAAGPHRARAIEITLGRVRHGRLRVRVGCPLVSPGGCHGTLKVTHTRRVARVELAAGASRVLRLRLTKRAARRRALTFVASAVARDETAAGTHSSARRRVRAE